MLCLFGANLNRGLGALQIPITIIITGSSFESYLKVCFVVVLLSGDHLSLSEKQTNLFSLSFFFNCKRNVYVPVRSVLAILG